MRQISYTEDSFHSLLGLVNYKSKNTNGAGVRWLNRYESFLLEKLISPDTVPFCSNKTFNHLQLRCVYFNDWVVAFSLSQDSALIEAILHKSRIAD